ncbi:hypothetical protein LGK97_18095 [Clostridium sp. CS001]|uniref:hypothetical protein n=1 Tax=Clostridium sp. CS001 TaxID=2880648 RepID=UPI001CF457B9|nr:hypothetical protein [Clostridium sp. CS001]MCB2291628.1 hypothetical protein [Clostridium sp. CS001]
MKLFSYLKQPLVFTLLVVFILLGFIGFNKISKLSDEKPALTNEQINKIKYNLKTFSSNPHLSNPLAHVEGHEIEYAEIIQMGEPVVDYFIDEFKRGNLSGGNEWLTAWICNEILGEKNPVKIWVEDNKNGWSTGADWYDKYIKINKIK